MTIVLSAGSTRKPYAQEFGRELKHAIRVRYVSIMAVSESVGLAYSVVRHYMAGYNLPKVTTAVKLADALGWPSLVEIAKRGRTKKCGTCGDDFLDGEGTTRLFCSTLCMEIDQKKHRGVSGRVRGAMAERTTLAALREIGTFKTAIAAMCDSCEPEGTCRQIDCPLRCVSPLPFMTEEARIVPRGKRKLKEVVAA